MAPIPPPEPDALAFDIFYRDAWISMVAIARPFVTDLSSAEDLAQDAFIKAERHWEQISRYDSPHAWVRRVLINRATSLRRRLGAETRMLGRLGRPSEETPAEVPETDHVWDQVRRLPRRQQQAVALHYVGQLSLEEVAATMECSVGSVKTHLHRARETLRRRLTHWKGETA